VVPSAVTEYLQLYPNKRSFVPYILFIDRKGIIRSQFTGSDQDFFNESKQAETIKAEAMKYLSEPVTAAPRPRPKK